jgi:hypothetical protein
MPLGCRQTDHRAGKAVPRGRGSLPGLGPQRWAVFALLDQIASILHNSFLKQMLIDIDPLPERKSTAFPFRLYRATPVLVLPLPTHFYHPETINRLCSVRPVSGRKPLYRMAFAHNYTFGAGT